jgi:hypothetical protein
LILLHVIRVTDVKAGGQRLDMNERVFVPTVVEDDKAVCVPYRQLGVLRY